MGVMGSLSPPWLVALVRPAWRRTCVRVFVLVSRPPRFFGHYGVFFVMSVFSRRYWVTRKRLENYQVAEVCLLHGVTTIGEARQAKSRRVVVPATADADRTISDHGINAQ